MNATKSVIVFCLVLLSGCYIQAHTFRKDFDWDNKRLRIAVVPSDNQEFDTLLVEELRNIGYTNAFIPATPPYGEVLKPEFMKAEVTIRTQRFLHTRENRVWIGEARLTMFDTRHYTMGGPPRGEATVLYRNDYEGEVLYSRDEMKRLVRALLDPLSRYVYQY